MSYNNKHLSNLSSQFPGTHGRRLAALLLSMVMILMVWTTCFAADTDGPLEAVQSNVEKVLGVLKDPAMQDDSAMAEKKAALRVISNDLFHWDLLSRYVLSKNWRSFSSEEQNEFIDLFKEILEQAYLDRILSYKDETIEYLPSRLKSDTKAEVETHILSSDGAPPINITYSLGLLNGKWGVYDLTAEDINLTQNYRKQFRDYLQDKSPADLLTYLKEKVEK